MHDLAPALTAIDGARTASSRRAFTLVEMLVVCGVIIALFGIGFPVLTMARANAMESGTVSLVEGVAAAIATYSTRSWTYDDGGTSRTVMLWNLNGSTTDRHASDPVVFGEIDGNPHHDETLPAAVVASGYVGFLDMVQPAVRPEAVNVRRQVIDAWGNPLLIRYPQVGSGMTPAEKRAVLQQFGSDGFQVFSSGPDGVPGNEDDIRHGEQSDD